MGTTSHVAPRVPSGDEPLAEPEFEFVALGVFEQDSTGKMVPSRSLAAGDQLRPRKFLTLQAPSLNSTLMAHVAITRQRPRERKERRTSRSVGSRGDPSPGDGEPEPPGLTASLLRSAA